MREEFESLNMLMSSVKVDMGGYEDRAMKLKDVCIVKITENQDNLLKKLEGYNYRINSLEGQQVTTSQINKLNREAIESINGHIQHLNKQNIELNSKVFELEYSKVQRIDYERDIKMVKEDLNYAKIGYEGMKHELQVVSNL